MARYNYLAFFVRLFGEGRLEEFSRRANQILHDIDTAEHKEALDKLCEEFGIRKTPPETMPAPKPLGGYHHIDLHFHPPEIYKALSAAPSA
jgi:hypothetical protein